MKLPLLIMAAALLAAGAYALTSATVTSPASQDKKGDDHTGQTQTAGASMDDMLPPWCKPGEEHELLAAREGKWNVKFRMFGPNGVEESEGTSEFRMIMGGRYLEDNMRATFGGMPFEGRGFTGFDVIKQKYCSTWIDSFSTAVLVFEFTWDPATKTMSGTHETPDMMTGKYVKSRSVEKMLSDDHFISEMYQPGPDGKEVKSWEIEYTRAK